ncbi:MAG: nitrite reductase large subunit NirB [Aquihabitans sp.]
MHRTARPPLRIVVIGNGMVGHRLLTTLADLGATPDAAVTVVAGEPRPAYDRVALSSWFAGRSAEDLSLVEPGFFADHGIEVLLGDPAEAIDRTAGTVTMASGRVVAYDRLVLATGSRPFIPPVPGHDGPGCFAYRTIADLEQIAAAAARPTVRRGVVIGGGLLGLEAANALLQLGLETHVVEFAPRLMPVQLDEGGSAALRRHIERLGVQVHTSCATQAIEHGDGQPVHLAFDGGDDLATDLVVFSAGIRPEDALARNAGLELGERGGIAVDARMRTSDPSIFAIGECAAVGGRQFGLVAPGYQMAKVAATHLAAAVFGAPEPAERFVGGDLSTKLKLLGVEVANVASVHDLEGCTSLIWDDPVAATYQRLDVDAEGRVRAAVLVGDASAFGAILDRFRSGEAVPAPGELLKPTAPVDPGAAPAPSTGICSCENVNRGAVCGAIAEGCDTVASLKKVTGAGTGCGGCIPLLEDLLRTESSGPAPGLCEHFALTRVELYDLIRVRRHTSFAEVIGRYGTAPGGCEVCKPTVASILASLDNGYILDGEQAALQDSNDHFLANIQRDGTYSVVPRVPGGEITPDGLITIGEVARDFDLYTKITGGQRIDLFGARVEQLPAIWRRLVDAGVESGHAYGTSLRTGKSCVGSSWCRYGVQDSTSMAILLEERYRGLRSPHKIKMAVSGCARECAEAQSKDVGVIATEKGWNLWVGGNGGMRPRHAELLAEDLSDDELIRAIDRFLEYYVRSADRLQRTASWIDGLDGGVDHVREVVIDDSLGLGAELESAMAAHVAAYECEWAATLDRPDRLARFVTYVNAPDEPDPTVVFVRERDQIRPARPDELVGANR